MEQKTINWKQKERIAKKMKIKELRWAIGDCIKTAHLGINSGYYYDEVSIYRKELAKREAR